MMDPKANIEEQRTLAYKLLNPDTTDTEFLDTSQRMEDALRLCELVLALDEWRADGGFDPYVETWEGIPTREQGVAFAERMARAGTQFANVSRGGQGLPDTYLLVIEDPHTRRFTYGIDVEGRVSS